MDNKESPSWRRRSEVVDWNMTKRVDRKWREFDLISCKENHRLITWWTLCNRLVQNGFWAIKLFQNLCNCHTLTLSSLRYHNHLALLHNIFTSPLFNSALQWPSPVVSSVLICLSEGPLLMVSFSPISLHWICSLNVKVTEWAPALPCRLVCPAACSLPYQTHGHTMLELS